VLLKGSLFDQLDVLDNQPKYLRIEWCDDLISKDNKTSVEHAGTIEDADVLLDAGHDFIGPLEEEGVIGYFLTIIFELINGQGYTFFF
jgi:hypothetical protein